VQSESRINHKRLNFGGCVSSRRDFRDKHITFRFYNQTLRIRRLSLTRLKRKTVRRQARTAFHAERFTCMLRKTEHIKMAILSRAMIYIQVIVRQATWSKDQLTKASVTTLRAIHISNCFPSFEEKCFVNTLWRHLIYLAQISHYNIGTYLHVITPPPTGQLQVVLPLSTEYDWPSGTRPFLRAKCAI